MSGTAWSPNTVYGLTPVQFALAIFRSHEFLTVTTVADSSVTGTFATTPRLYLIIYNPSSTATVFANWGAAASASAGMDIAPQSALSLGLITDDVRIFSATGSIACKVMGLS